MKRQQSEPAIRRLRWRFCLLVWVGLLAVIAAVVIAINWVNWSNLERDARSTLNLLQSAEPMIAAPGERPAEPTSLAESGSTPRPLPEGEEPRMDAGRNRMGRDFSQRSRTMADLANTYVIRVDEEGNVTSWSSERSSLYTEESIRAMAAAALATSRTEGRVDDQFFSIRQEPQGGCSITVLDARVEMESAQSVLRITCWVALAAWLLMSALAWVLIRRMIRPVEEAFQRQQQFVWDASHELKTPLAVISANADVLRGEIGDNEWLGYIQSEVGRTDTLVQNLLTLARLDRGSGTLAMAEFDLSRSVLETVLPFESTVYEAGKTLETDIPAGIRCTGNEDMLQQLLMILLSNALKYSDENGVITLTLAKKGDKKVLTVHNTGEPIAPKDLPHVFDRFYRGDASHSSRIAGNGLGLAIAQQIAQAHRAKLEVISAAGEGTAFILTVP